MNSVEVLNLQRLARNISNIATDAGRLDELRRKMRDAVKNDNGNGGDEWNELRKITIGLMSECDRSLHADLEQAAIELTSLSDRIGLSTR